MKHIAAILVAPFLVFLFLIGVVWTVIEHVVSQVLNTNDKGDW